MTATECDLEIATERDGKTKHKVSVKQGETVLHLDTLNLSSAQARKKFLDGLADKYTGIDRERLEAELLKLATTSANHADNDGTKAEPDRLAGTPQEIINEASAFLDDPELITRVCDDIATIGVSGERELAATVYLIGTSRLLSQPLAGIIRGSSSSGKSYTIEKVASLFPPECLVRATQMTPQALFHMKPGRLVHRWVVGGERSRLEDDDRAEATRALREMIASGWLSKLMPVKAGNGIETQVIEQEGPIAFTESTTLTTVFEEDANRCIMLQTDETPAQTRRILSSLARQQSGESADRHRVIQLHHAIQRMLPLADIRVPYAEKLASEFKCDRVEVRRAFPQLLTMIQVCALLHHRQRDKGDDGAILANELDYHLARRLILKPFSQSLGGGLSESALGFLKKLPTSKEFTAKGIAKDLKVAKSSASGWLSELNDAGAVDVLEAGRGSKPTTWKVTGKSPDAGEELLPLVETVFSKLAGRLDTKQSPNDS